MKRYPIEHDGQTLQINPTKIGSLITKLHELQSEVMPPPQTGKIREGYIGYHEACDILRTIAPRPLGRAAIKYRVGRIWTACQRDPRYGSLPYDGYCTVCGVLVSDQWQHGRMCAPTANNSWRVAISKQSIIDNKDQFAAITYRGASDTVKEAYMLLVDYFVEHGVT